MKGLNYLAILGCAACLGDAAFAKARQITITDDYSTVYGVAHENGVPTHSVVSANNLKPPYALYKGQELTIPAANEHIVGNGETLEQIAEKYGVNPDLLAQDNDVRSVRDGDLLTIPSRDTEPLAGAERAAGDSPVQASSLEPLPLVPAETAPTSSPLASAPAAAPLPPELADEIAREKQAVQAPAQASSSTASSVGNLAAAAPAAALPAATSEKPKEKSEKPKPVAAAAKPQAATAKPEKKEPAKTVEAKEFIWPLKGPVISKFSAGKNDGINISAPVGTPVKASATGTVMYAGNELKGFGNLLLVKHEGGWITAYAHNSKLLVKKGDKVTQGQDIAHSGRTGDVNEPQLHFEVRKGKQPVDPTPKLGS